MLIVGEPGIGKTTLANTAEATVLIDFDGGAVRTGFRKADIAKPTNFADLLKFAETLRNYKTVVIDTAGALIERVIYDHVKTTPSFWDFATGQPNQKGWGAVKNCFKQLESALQKNGVDLIYLAHEKTVEAKRGGTSKSEPSIVGSASQIILASAHQVGFMYAEGSNRVLNFSTDQSFTSKDSAGVGKVYVQNMTENPNQFPNLIAEIKRRILDNANRYAKVDEELVELRALIASGITDPDAAALVQDRINEYNGAAKNALKMELLAEAGRNGLAFNRERKEWEYAAN